MTKRLHLDIIGKGHPLIMLHGWGWNSCIWQPLVPKLIENFQLFLIDLPGFGESPLVTKDYKIDDVVKVLLEITPKEASWLGWSLGGMIAWYVALHYPERVTSLVTVASSPKFISEENWPGVSLETLEKFSHLITENYQKTLLEFLELQLRGTPKNRELLESLKEIILRSPVSIAALSGGLKLLQELDLRGKLFELQCPSLHLFGSHDTLVPASVIEKIEGRLPKGKCGVIKRAGHMPFLSHEEVFLKWVEEFL
ncbi:MAG TPA: pimeloyl-ACP methyl ester esterase BioH [Gammaproteobacteria bacterium]|nr:pimeloyl-ACP methyl ester esterase BioH [Gammaproteobacteria bacterium]